MKFLDKSIFVNSLRPILFIWCFVLDLDILSLLGMPYGG